MIHKKKSKNLKTRETYVRYRLDKIYVDKYFLTIINLSYYSDQIKLVQYWRKLHIMHIKIMYETIIKVSCNLQF